MSGTGHQEKRLLWVTVCFAVILAAASLFSLLKRPSKVEVTLDSTATSGRRSPASVRIVNDNTEKASFNKSTSVGLGCDTTALPSVGRVSHLRLHGKDCEQLGEVVSIKNMTNGFTAQVILTHAGFTTDFIDLNEGLNQISVSRRSTQGQLVEKVISVSRAPASDQ